MHSSSSTISNSVYPSSSEKKHDQCPPASMGLDNKLARICKLFALLAESVTLLHSALVVASRRRLIPVDIDHEFDRTLQVNRGFLDQIAVELEEEMPDQLRALQEEATAEAADEADGTSSDEDEGPGDGIHDGWDKDQDEEDGDDVDHDGEEQEVETLETSP
jgi:hypothetical protein